MSQTPEPNAAAAGDTAATAAAAAERDLTRVQGKVDAARAVLLRLLQEVVVAESRLNSNQASQMLEANEQLVVAALRDQAVAQAAAQSLSDATRLAEIDPLTRLPNRALLLDRFAQAIATAKRRASRLALLFLDLDDFKQINDSMGHVAGDEALQQVARRLGQSVREGDTVSRHGGDEFLILLTDVSHATDAAAISAKLLDGLAEAFRVGDRDLQLTASIGISIYPDDGDSIEALIGHADAAMYRAKSQGPGRFALHSDPAPQRQRLPPPSSPDTHAQALSAHERRHAQLREANEQLVLAALGAQELQAAAERAQQRQADFMAAVAEEMGNPFAPIRLAAAMLGRAPGHDDLLPRAQAMVEQQAARIARLVQAANARAHATGLLTATAPQASDLATVIDTAVRGARPVMDLRQQRLTVVVPADPVAVRADVERLSHVLGNLLDNASKYTPDNGSIRLDAVIQGPNLVLSVTDDGIGITPAAVPGIFEPFGHDSRAIG
jgi:diguanylate cyclase